MALKSSPPETKAVGGTEGKTQDISCGFEITGHIAIRHTDQRKIGMEEWVSHVPSSEESACVLYLSADSEMTSFPRLCLENSHTHLPADVLLGRHYFSAPSSHPRPAFGAFGVPMRATSDFYAFL